MHNEDRTGKTILNHVDLTDKILAAFYAVYRAPGYGFLEKVYQNASAVIRARSAIIELSESYRIRSGIAAKFWSEAGKTLSRFR
jgi:hypothetical protein